MTDRPEHLLVDGYNVIKTTPYFQHFERQSLERARNALQSSLNAYVRRTGARVDLYFDGSEAVALPQEQECGAIQIFFSRPPQLADDLIKAAVQRMHGAKRVRVISSDREIRNFARRHKIRTSATEEFFEELAAESVGREAPVTRSTSDMEMPDDIVLNEREIGEWENLFATGRDAKTPNQR